MYCLYSLLCYYWLIFNQQVGIIFVNANLSITNRQVGIIFVNANLSITNRHLFAQRQQWKHQSNAWNLFKVNNKVIDVVLVYLLLNLNNVTNHSGISIVDFEQVNVGLVVTSKTHAFLYKQHFYKQHHPQIGKKLSKS